MLASNEALPFMYNLLLCSQKSEVCIGEFSSKLRVNLCENVVIKSPQAFLKAPLDLSGLTDLLISQARHIGSVVKV